jgi:uncharacterized protein
LRILTNSHVVYECRSLTSVGEENHRFTSFVIKDDTENDLAILGSLAKHKDVAAFCEPMAIRAGEEVVVFGFPYTGILANSSEYQLRD